MKVTVIMLYAMLLLLLGSSSSQTSFMEYCSNDYNEGCGLLGGLPEVNCTEGKTCNTDGCRTQCIEPVYPNGCSPDDPDCDCPFKLTTEDNCPEDQLCCYDNCTFACKDKRYAKRVCPDPSYNVSQCLTEFPPCLNDRTCKYGRKCCPGFCPLFKICTFPVYKRAVCPESFEIYDRIPDPDPCSSHNDCIDNDQLCCRLYADRNDTYCREPEYVVDDDMPTFSVLH
ncbi:UNVERIFIED_CONTAM: hypothetical protein RMT77_005817 [Armadillidium vulgare]